MYITLCTLCTLLYVHYSMYTTLCILCTLLYVQVCWSMLAITVAVRIDVYGVIYCVALGFLLFIPRKVLVPVWLLYLVVHGILLLIQYFFLLGAPPGVCFTQDQHKGLINMGFSFPLSTVGIQN